MLLAITVRRLGDDRDHTASPASDLAAFTAASLGQRLWEHAADRPAAAQQAGPERLWRRDYMALRIMPLGLEVLIPVALLAPNVAITV